MADLLDRLGGAFVPLVTPVDRTGGLDLDSLVRLVRHVLAGGVDGIWVCGTSGEFHLLDDAERTEVLRVVVEEVNGLIEQYVGADTLERQTYEVVIVPQSAEQFEAVEAIIPGASVSERRGGKVISVGTFFSHDYAEAVCQKYIALGLFTAQVAS